MTVSLFAEVADGSSNIQEEWKLAIGLADQGLELS